MPKQSRDELVGHLREQVGFLRNFGATFDAGGESHAKPLATAIRVLVHESRGKSLLRQLRVKDHLQFIDTTSPPPPSGAIVIGSGLAVIRMGFGEEEGTGYAAPLDGRTRRPVLRFRPWWSQPVLDDGEGSHFNRRDLVLGLAHKDGGAHVDLDLERAYAALSRSNSLGWEFGAGDGDDWTPAGSPIPANVRQIGYELECTLTEQLAELIVQEV